MNLSFENVRTFTDSFRLTGRKSTDKDFLKLISDNTPEPMEAVMFITLMDEICKMGFKKITSVDIASCKARDKQRRLLIVQTSLHGQKLEFMFKSSETEHGKFIIMTYRPCRFRQNYARIGAEAAAATVTTDYTIGYDMDDMATAFEQIRVDLR